MNRKEVVFVDIEVEKKQKVFREEGNFNKELLFIQNRI